MPFTEHLRELRNRLLISIAIVGGLSVLLFWPSQFIIKWMMNQYFHGVTLHAFGPADVIITELKFSVIGGIVVGLPVLLSQIWLFVVPAVNPRTRRMVYSFVVPSLLLAFAGLAFAHFLVIPRVIAALLALTSQVAEATFGISSTLNFVMILLALFAMIFQLADHSRRLGAPGHRQRTDADEVSPARVLRHDRRRAVSRRRTETR